jgi:hypothetical protein
MTLQAEEILIDFVNKYGYLFEESKILLEEVDDKNDQKKIKEYYDQKKRDLDKKEKEILNRIESNKEAYKETLKSFGEDLRDKIIDEIDEKVNEKKARTREFFAARRAMLTSQQKKMITKTKKGGLILAGTTLAAMLIFSSIKLYQRDQELFKEKCKNYIGKQKKKCILKSRVILLRNRSNFLKTALTKCKYSKDPIACRGRIDKEMLKIEEKIKEFLSEIGENIV